MMFGAFRFTAPGPGDLAALREDQRGLTLTYEPAGLADGETPDGFQLDEVRQRLGRGPVVFERGCEVLRRWDHFPREWVTPWPVDAPPAPGVLVVVTARVFGLWCLNVCRVVRVDDLEGRRRIVGFSYGTLPAHVECGEERFRIVRDLETDEVTCEIRACSRPAHPLTRLLLPLARSAQRRFLRDSMARMASLAGDAGGAGGGGS